MRLVALLVGTSMLAACGGGGSGVGSAGTAPPPVAGNAPPPSSAHSFVNPTEVKTYRANGVTHRLQTTISATSIGEQYAGNATTVRNSGINVTYNPRDAIFELVISNNLSGVSQNIRFQDPIHRTDFGGVIEPQNGVPNFATPGIQYLQVGGPRGLLLDGSLEIAADVELPASYDATTFFYQRPGTSTNYVTFAGYLRNALNYTNTDITETLSRGAFVFGEQTLNSNVQRTGTGTFNGNLLATAVLNDRPDFDPSNPTVFQWIDGRSNVAVDFAANTFNLALDGNVYAPVSGFLGDGDLTVSGGATFAARGSGRIDLVSAGGFLGQFQQAWFVNPNNTRFDVKIEGSSIDGAFYGPQAQEVGGSFRIVGGTPDERIDILGVFTGRR